MWTTKSRLREADQTEETQVGWKEQNQEGLAKTEKRWQSEGSRPIRFPLQNQDVWLNRKLVYLLPRAGLTKYLKLG
jgi:hypothetical protein